ncbi:MAG: cation:proton antiporter [Candidatus Paceibacterota bacterium]
MASALLSFFIILFAGLFFSEIFNRFHLPWVVALIVAGIVVGPQGLALVSLNETVLFIAEIGLIFLMFMAGLEARLSSFAGLKKEIVIAAALGITIPFLAGFGVGNFFELGRNASVLLGVIFISSSVAVVIPTLERAGKLGTKVGKLIVDTTIVLDISSLFLLSLIFQTTNDLSPIQPGVLYPLILVLFAGLRWIKKPVEKVMGFLFADEQKGGHELQVVLVMLLGSVIAFQIVGLHPIVGGFLAGLILSDSVRKDQLKGKLSAISYGLFIPIFFMVVGAKIDISAFTSADKNILNLTVATVAALILAKFVAGYLAGRLNRIPPKEAGLMGVAGIPQLSTTLAVAFSGLELGIIHEDLISSLVILSAITTFVGPLLIQGWLRLESPKK